MKRLPRIKTALAVCFPLVLAQRTEALVYCVTNAVDVHQVAPTGELANSGWYETAPIGMFLGTVIQSNAMLTAKHIWEITVGAHFTYEGEDHTVTAKADDAESDLTVLFFAPPATNLARINIETNEISAYAVLQGRGMERGDEVVTDGRTNGWKWAWVRWYGIRRWGANRYVGEADYGQASDGILAVAAFDNNGDPDECMLSVGDSGGPGFVRTGSGWKVATVNYSVYPSSFTASTNPVFAFDASLFDCAGLYYGDGASWQYVVPEASPAPCLMLNTRISKRVDWITNTVAGITFPADVGVAWKCETNHPSAKKAAEGLWFEVVATNAGPYTARDLAIDLSWHGGIRLRGSAATCGTFATNRWSLPSLEDGGAATLRVAAVVWRSTGEWGTNRVSVTSSDKPDGVVSNNSAVGVVFLPATATRLLVE